MKAGKAECPWTSLLLMGTCSLPLISFGKLVRPAGGGTFVQLVSHFLRCELCDAKHVGTCNHIECPSKRKKRSAGIYSLQGISSFQRCPSDSA